MFLEIAFLALLILGLCVLSYRGAIHEFQVLQKDYVAADDDAQPWSELLSEDLPVVVRGIPRAWSGGWNARLTSAKNWTTIVRNAEGRKLRTTWANWLATPAPRPQPENAAALGAAARLSHAIASWTADGFRRWSWLPPACPTPAVLGRDAFLGVQKTAAQFTVVVATDGAPCELWIAHEGAVPADVCNDLIGLNPWIQTTAEIPWIDSVKYIEIKLRPGNAVAIPRHWWYAVRSSCDDDAWLWVGEFHTPVSWMATAARRAPKN